jgi:REP element-mobilizing transposase RayT
MPRRKVQFAKGHYYHIYNRGAGRQAIIREERNYQYLVHLLSHTAKECQVAVIAYCLLPNHYHWLLRQDGDMAAGNVPRRVFMSYSQALNKAYDRTGTLFEGSYKAILVDNDAYLCTLCRYIHLNPVKHGLVSLPEDWPYSNYLEWVEQRSGTLVDRQFIGSYFSSAMAYAEFVREALVDPFPSLLPGDPGEME